MINNNIYVIIIYVGLFNIIQCYWLNKILNTVKYVSSLGLRVHNNLHDFMYSKLLVIIV